MKTLGRVIAKIEDIVVMISVFFMTVIFFLQILFRYLFKIPMHWTEEVVIYLAMWCAFIGASIGARLDNHIEIGLWDKIAESNPRLLSLMKCIASFIAASSSLILAYWQVSQMMYSTKIHLVSPILKIPNAVPEAGIFFGLLGMGIYFLLRSIRIATSLMGSKKQ